MSTAHRIVSLLVLTGCSGAGSSPTSPSAGYTPTNPSAGSTPSSPPASVASAPRLLAPPAGHTVRQNDPSSGCARDPFYGSGYRIVFDWEDLPGASAYHLLVRHPQAVYPLVDAELSGSRHEYASCGFVVDGNREGWIWRVRAREAGGGWGAWSAERSFRFESCSGVISGCTCPAPTPAVVATPTPKPTPGP